jgi:hypothetical protein
MSSITDKGPHARVDTDTGSTQDRALLLHQGVDGALC